jgi:hypothetical protein
VASVTDSYGRILGFLDRRQKHIAQFNSNLNTILNSNCERSRIKYGDKCVNCCIDAAEC